jgi:CHRD domain
MKRLSMKRLAVCAIAVLAICGASCNDDDNPTGATGQPTTLVYTATILPANEVPAITNAESTGSGNATITFHLTRDASGNITAATVDFATTFTGFTTNVIGTAAHIHQGAAGTAPANNIVINTGAASGSFSIPANGTGSLVQNGATVSPVDVANQIIANPAGFYFNTHSQLNPGGFARGQLVLKP